MADLSGGSTVAGSKIWHSGNDGKDSGLDADKMKGQNWTVSATAPTTPQVNDIWVDTSS